MYVCRDTCFPPPVAIGSGSLFPLSQIGWKSRLSTKGEARAQAAQGTCGCPIPGGIQGQVPWGPGQPELVPDLVAGSLACGIGLNLDDL